MSDNGNKKAGNSCVVCGFFRNVEAAWTEDHALAWHLEEEFRQNSATWALEKCLAWDQLENQLPDFLSEIIDCPCTIAQARADTGRFHVRVRRIKQKWTSSPYKNVIRIRKISFLKKMVFKNRNIINSL